MSKVKFDYHNLKNDSGMRNLDVIFCRNVMIYFDEETKNDLVNRIYDMLVPGGYMFIGTTEAIDKSRTKFQFVRPSVYRK